MLVGILVVAFVFLVVAAVYLLFCRADLCSAEAIASLYIVRTLCSYFSFYEHYHLEERQSTIRRDPRAHIALLESAYCLIHIRQ